MVQLRLAKINPERKPNPDWQPNPDSKISNFNFRTHENQDEAGPRCNKSRRATPTRLKHKKDPCHHSPSSNTPHHASSSNTLAPLPLTSARNSSSTFLIQQNQGSILSLSGSIHSGESGSKYLFFVRSNQGSTMCPKPQPRTRNVKYPRE